MKLFWSIAIGGLIAAGSAVANPIPTGSNFWHVSSGALNFTFDDSLLPVPIMGHPPVPVHNADTIVNRLDVAGSPSFPDTIPIEIVALSLQSVAPITIGGNPYTVEIELITPLLSGQLTVNHEFADNGTGAAEGTFTSFFDVFVEIDVQPLGPGVAQTFTNQWQFQQTAPGQWSHSDSSTHVVDGMYILDPPFSISQISGPSTITGTPGDNTVFYKNAFIPEPGAAVFLAIGGLLLVRRRVS